MSDQRYPLAWPAGWPRTPAMQRRDAKFSSDRHKIGVGRAVSRIREQLGMFTKPGQRWRIDPETVVISTNLKVRIDGLPRADQAEPSDPGAAIYFELDGVQKSMACDVYLRVAINLAGIAASLEALRALERHGSGLMERAFTGFEALPHLSSSGWDHWTVVLGVEATDPWSHIEDQYLHLRSIGHPDKGGNPELFDQIVKAYERAKLEVGPK